MAPGSQEGGTYQLLPNGGVTESELASLNFDFEPTTKDLDISFDLGSKVGKQSFKSDLLM